MQLWLSIWFAPSTQAQVVPLREYEPALQGWLGFVVHEAPRLQLTHVLTPSQKPPLHGVPSASGVVVSMHDCTPVAQEEMPALHGVGFVEQLPPCAHETHMPDVLQTLFVPHAAPAPSVIDESLHTATPVAQSVMPALHAVGLVLHAAFWVHAVHAPPALQTLFVPQLAPAPLG
jgi:hypothetical protein